MSTTNLFVELLVIGVGAACWVVLLLASIFGVEWLQAEILQTYPALVGMLAIVYLLGIISDRVADFLFDVMFSGTIRARYFSEKRLYQDARRLVFSNSNRLADQHEYGRTRIRICRGWAMNATIMTACLFIFVRSLGMEYTGQHALLAWGMGGCTLLSVTAWWAWRMLCSTEYLKIREHAQFLRKESPAIYHKTAACRKPA